MCGLMLLLQSSLWHDGGEGGSGEEGGSLHHTNWRREEKGTGLSEEVAGRCFATRWVKKSGKKKKRTGKAMNNSIQHEKKGKKGGVSAGGGGGEKDFCHSPPF